MQAPDAMVRRCSAVHRRTHCLIGWHHTVGNNLHQLGNRLGIDLEPEARTPEPHSNKPGTICNRIATQIEHKSKPEPHWHQYHNHIGTRYHTGPNLEPSWSQTGNRRITLEPEQRKRDQYRNQTGTKPEPYWNHMGSKLEPNRNNISNQVGITP